MKETEKYIEYLEKALCEKTEVGKYMYKPFDVVLYKIYNVQHLQVAIIKKQTKKFCTEDFEVYKSYETTGDNTLLEAEIVGGIDLVKSD